MPVWTKPSPLSRPHHWEWGNPTRLTEGRSSAEVPETKTQVSSFISLTSYYRKFVPDYASIATPLTNLLCKKQPEKITWSDECEKAFQTLKTSLLTHPVLKVPEANGLFIVHTDASDSGLGAVLSQVGEDGEEHPIAYASRKLKPSESRYSTIEKECLAAVWALKHFEPYLYGQLFTLVTDHRPLTWLKTMKNSNQRLTRWAVFLQQFKMEVLHRPGSQYKNADGLSRGGRDVTEPAKCSPDSESPRSPELLVQP